MGALKIILPDDVEIRFRRMAMHRFGYSKGSLSEAAEQALSQWASEDEFREEAASIKDPVMAIAGLLKGIKKTSVELQHEIGRIWGKEHAGH